ncbi:MAG: hypothetical protein ACYDCO_19065 [Armatimonadota bacterium]
MPAVLKMTGRAEEILTELDRLQQQDVVIESDEQRMRRLMIRWFTAAGVIFFIAVLMGGDYFFTPTGLAIRLAITGASLASLIIALSFRKRNASAVREDIDDEKIALVSQFVRDIHFSDRFDVDISFAPYTVHGKLIASIDHPDGLYHARIYSDTWFSVTMRLPDWSELHIAITREVGHINTQLSQIIHEAGTRENLLTELSRRQELAPLLTESDREEKSGVEQLAAYGGSSFLNFRRRRSLTSYPFGLSPWTLIQTDVTRESLAITVHPNGSGFSSALELEKLYPGFTRVVSSNTDSFIDIHARTPVSLVSNEELDPVKLEESLEKIDLFDPLIKPVHEEQPKRTWPCYITAVSLIGLLTSIESTLGFKQGEKVTST